MCSIVYAKEITMLDEHYIIGKIMTFYPVMDKITEEEKEFFTEWIAKEENKEWFDSMVTDQTTITGFLEEFLWAKEERKEINRDRYFAGIEKLPSKRKIFWLKRWQTYVAAASIVTIVSLVGYQLWIGKNKEQETLERTTAKINDINPGKFNAKLMLDDGSIFILDSSANGKTIHQRGTTVINKDGKLVYKENGNAGKELFNTLSTAKGETYATVLSDGTQVWLNSESSIKYPVSFGGDMRQVEVNGEAYFEVAPSISLNANGGKIKRPFVVNATGLDVTVLGTHFNVNSYVDEEAVKTTLLEGKVKVHTKSNNAITILEPGQQAKFNKQSQELKKIEDADVDEAVAWHYGYFQFGREDLRSVLKQLGRWYDVDVVYQGTIPERSFGGKISRGSSLKQVLETLESNDVHFKIEGRKIIVTP